MKEKLLLLLALLICATTAHAYDFQEQNDDGKTIYYSIQSNADRTVEVTNRSGILGTQYNCYSGDVVIPSTVTYNSVTYSVTKIGDSAFRECKDLTSITIPNSITSIGVYAFFRSTGLTSVVIPESVTSIGSAAFNQCDALTSVTIPESVTSIGVNAFSYNAMYENENNWENGALYISNCLVAVKNVAGTYSIKEGTRIIADEVFKNCNGLESVIIPNSVITIGNSAFEGRKNLTSVIIGNSVATIGSYAFKNCTGLTSVSIPESVTSIGSCAFEGCTALTSITIPESVTSIGTDAFYGTELYNNEDNWENDVLYLSNCLIRAKTSLSGSYAIKEGTRTIVGGALRSCTKLTSVSIPESVTSIGKYAFAYCSGLATMSIPNSVTSIGESAFMNCSGLTSVTLPTTLTEIVSGTFYGCNHLTSVIIPESVKVIGYNAFKDCTRLSSITIPNSVKSIGGYAFSGCDRISSLVIPESVKGIESWAFNGCTGLTSVTINDAETMLSLDPYTFVDCKIATLYVGRDLDNWRCLTFHQENIKTATIGGSVSSIGNDAFKNCVNLTSVTIDNSVTSISGNAFQGCTGLMRVPTKVESDEFSVTCLLTGCNIANVSKYFIGYDQNYLANIGDNIVIYNYPGTQRNYRYGFRWKESDCYIGNMELTTRNPDVIVDKVETATSYRGNLRINTSYDYELYWSSNQHETEAKTGLDPNQSYTSSYYLALSGADRDWSKNYPYTFKTAELSMATLPGVALNTTTALLCAEANIDDNEVNVGFEWRRYDAPATMPSNKVVCAIDDGKIQGALMNLNPDVYYNYRPYYTSNSGNTYYGSWITFFTGDAMVYFDPTVKTYAAEMVNEFSAVLKGYALRGTSDITAQGFEYWSVWGDQSRAASDVMEVTASGQKMSITIEDLTPATKYEYRAFVQTANGRVYGDTMSFTTGEDSGIEPALGGNAADAHVIGYYNLQGLRSERPMRGYNIVVYSDGWVRKLLIK